MIDIPSDRLHNFLAIGGLVLVAIGIVYPLQKYQDAELERIDALEKIHVFANTAGRAGNKLALIHPFYQKALKDGPTSIAATEFGRRAVKEIPEMEVLLKDSQQAGIEAMRNVQLMQHYYFIRNLWFGIGSVLVISGLISSIAGFYTWLKQPKRAR